MAIKTAHMRLSPKRNAASQEPRFSRSPVCKKRAKIVYPRTAHVYGDVNGLAR